MALRQYVCCRCRAEKLLIRTILVICSDYHYLGLGYQEKGTKLHHCVPAAADVTF